MTHQERADRRPEARHGPRVERVREREAAGAGDALGHDRRADQLRQLHELGQGVAVGDGVPRHEQRALGLREQRGRAGHRGAVADDAGRDARRRAEVQVPLGVEHVDRQREEHGPRRMRERGLRGAVDDARQVLEPARLGRPLDERLGHGRQIRPEDRLGHVERLVVLARGEEQRRPGFHRVVEHAHRVPEAGRDVDVHRAEAARGLGVAVGHRDRDRLLERQDVVDPGLTREAVHQRQLGRPRVAEHDRDAFLLQDLEERLLARDVCHGAR